MSAGKPATGALDQSRAFERVAAQLRGQIISGELQSGDRLPTEPELCASYRVSRSTVREALRLLSSQGLVVTTRGVTGGSFVLRPGPEHISSYLEDSLQLLTGTAGVSVAHLLEVRAVLEVQAAALAAQRRTKAQLDRVEAALCHPGELDMAALFRANHQFHVSVLMAAGNPLLEAVTRPVFRVVQERFRRADAGRRFWARVDQDHHEIFECLAARDAAGAAAAQAAHLRRLRGTYIRIDGARRRAANES